MKEKSFKALTPGGEDDAGLVGGPVVEGHGHQELVGGGRWKLGFEEEAGGAAG